MTDIQKIIQLLLPELLALIDGKNSPDLLQKGLDNKRIKSIHVVEKGVENVSLGTFLLLLKAIGQIDALDELMPDLPPSAYLVKEEKKVQRIRHKKS